MTKSKADLWINQPFELPPKPVGFYKRDDIQLMMITRPNWFQQKMTKWFFGWEWIDR